MDLHTQTSSRMIGSLRKMEEATLASIPSMAGNAAIVAFTEYVALAVKIVSFSSPPIETHEQKRAVDKPDRNFVVTNKLLSRIFDLCAHLSLRASEFLPPSLLQVTMNTNELEVKDDLISVKYYKESAVLWIAHVVNALLDERRLTTVEAEQMINSTNSMLLHENEWLSASACLIQGKLADMLDRKTSRYPTQMSILTENMQAVAQKSGYIGRLLSLNTFCRLQKQSPNTVSTKELIEWMLVQWGSCSVAQGCIFRILFCDRYWWSQQTPTTYKQILSFLLQRIQSIESIPSAYSTQELLHLLSFFGAEHVIPVVLRSAAYAKTLWSSVLAIENNALTPFQIRQDARCMLSGYLSTPACRLTPSQRQTFASWETLLTEQTMQNETEHQSDVWQKLMAHAFDNLKARSPLS
eukprot:TRINITY_DN10172_c0_g2_i1.p1 TRINITY_DN10172_c0_g2~~TRINITY_DN10172_c0_g2_i1.p1  ORF type:complete len:410 (+),score=90.96 TRINITY_DN10172_c0_g2_i1:57-1286(+)